MSYKLSINTKRLTSGKCQVKFVVSNSQEEVMYGYVLSEAHSTLKEVVAKIENSVKQRIIAKDDYLAHLGNYRNYGVEKDIIIFQNS